MKTAMILTGVHVTTVDKNPDGTFKAIHVRSHRDDVEYQSRHGARKAPCRIKFLNAKVFYDSLRRPDFSLPRHILNVPGGLKD